MCLLGLLGGITAGFFVGKINEKFLIIIFLLSGLKYLYEYLKKKKEGVSVNLRKNYFDMFISAYLSAFLQTFGISVGSIRQGYYFSKGYTLQNVQGTVAVIFLFSGIGIIASRIFSEKIDYSKILDILPIFPIMLIVMYFSKKILYKIPKSWQEKIITYSLIFSLLSVIPLILK